MKNLIVTITIIVLTTCLTIAQNSVRFGNITEATVALQLGKTTRVTSFNNGEIESEKARYTYPAPRVATAFGIHVADMLFIGPGVAYAFQSRDDENGYAHQVSAFGQTRVHIPTDLVRPYFDFKGGYHFASWEETSMLFNKDWYKWDGFFLEPAFGLSFKLKGNTYLNGSLGYQFIQAGNRIKQSIMTESGDPMVNAALNEKYHRLLLSVGFTF